MLFEENKDGNLKKSNADYMLSLPNDFDTKICLNIDNYNGPNSNG